MEAFLSLVERLKEMRLHVAAAESCTAGLFSASIADIPGASDVMEYGFVVYSVGAKCRMLGVSPQTVAEHGVVSEPVALEMAFGAAAAANAEAGVGITGFAGPGADDGFPVGRVCFGYAVNGRPVSETVEFGDVGRNEVRRRSAEHAAQKLLYLLSENV